MRHTSMLPPSSHTNTSPDGTWTVQLSTAFSAAPAVTAASYSTEIVCVARSSSHTRRSPLVVRYRIPSSIHSPSPPLNGVVSTCRSGELDEVGTHVTRSPVTLAANNCPDVRSPGTVGTKRYNLPAGSSSVR
jgi:hypothetical protein